MIVPTPSAVPTPIARPPAPSRLHRFGPALARRLSLIAVRLRHPRARFGPRCDVRHGFLLHLGPAGQADFGAGCVLDRDMTVECHGRLHVGTRTIFGHHVTIGVADSVTIGRDCLIAEMVSIRDHDHRFDGPLDVPIRDQGSVSAPVRIGSNVWLASKVTVLKGVTIGDNAVVGANAVVTRDLPANAVAVGIPAHVVRFRE